MKKFFTLACAAILAISASAFTPVKMMERNAKKDFQPVDLELTAKSELKAEKHVRAPFQMPAQHNIRKAAAATQDYTPVAPASAEAIGWDSYYGDGSWTINLYGGAGDTTEVGVLSLFGPSTANTFAGTYTVDLANYCYVEFVRGEGDTLLSVLDGETFEISYVSQNVVDGEVLTTYHIQGDLTADAEMLHLDFDFTVAGGIDYLWYIAYYVDGSIVGLDYPIYMYCMYAGQLCQYESYVWITLMDYMVSPVVVTGDTIEFSSPYQLMPEFKYFAEAGVNRLIFRDNEAILAPNDTASIFAAIYFTADSLEEGEFDLTDQDQAIVYYNQVAVMHNGDTATYEININEESKVVVTKSADQLATYFDVYLAARDGNVYFTHNVYYMPTVEADSLVYAFQFNSSTGMFDAPGAVVDTTYLASDGDVMFGAYGLGVDALGHIQEAYWLTLDVIVGDNSYIGTYTKTDTYVDYCEFYNAWEGYGLSIIDINFEIIDTDMSGFGDLIVGSVATTDGLIHPFVMPFVHPEDPTTAVKNNAVDVKVEKVIKNGQLIIRKNGKEFNVMGAQL